MLAHHLWLTTIWELLAAGQERSFDPKSEDLSSFEKKLTIWKSSKQTVSASHTSKKESVTSSGKGLPDPTLEGVDSFDKRASWWWTGQLPTRKMPSISCEHISRTRAEVDCTYWKPSFHSRHKTWLLRSFDCTNSISVPIQQLYITGTFTNSMKNQLWKWEDFDCMERYILTSR